MKTIEYVATIDVDPTKYIPETALVARGYGNLDPLTAEEERILVRIAKLVAANRGRSTQIPLTDLADVTDVDEAFRDMNRPPTSVKPSMGWQIVEYAPPTSALGRVLDMAVGVPHPEVSWQFPGAGSPVWLEGRALNATITQVGDSIDGVTLDVHSVPLLVKNRYVTGRPS